MTELVELSSSRHGRLRVVANSSLAYASRLHALKVRVAEVGKAVSSFPVFLSRNSITGDWQLSAVASFEQGSNLFVENEEWMATYQPTALLTYPLFLMNSPAGDHSYTVGIDENNGAFSEQQGEALFDDNGKATPYLRQLTTMLEADIQNDIQTYQFGTRLDQLGLIKAIDVQVQYGDDSVQTLRGLHTLDEDKLQSLTAEQLLELSGKGYLAPIYAMLVSIFQLNALIKRHNRIDTRNHIKQVKLEVARDGAPA